MTVDWSLCRYPACIEECRDGPKIDCPAVLAWREKKDETMTDISKEAVERLAKTADLFAKAMKAFQHHTKKHNEDVRDTLRAQAARIAELEAALAEVPKVADQLGHHCVGCGRLCGDPEKDLATIRKSGGISCCPERKMEPLSETFKAMLPMFAKDTSHDG